VGFRDVILGRSKPPKPNLDALFALTNAALTLEAAMDLRMTGHGAVCFRGAEGPAFRAALADVVELLDNDDDPDLERTTDSFGFTWLLAKQTDMSSLVTDLHAINTSLEMQGFSEGLLCSLVTFSDPSGRTLGLVYLYKQGTFYPFAPVGERRRDNLLEIQVRDLLADDLPIERDLARWMALWGAPGL
jgi:hypothetical protein